MVAFGNDFSLFWKVTKTGELRKRRKIELTEADSLYTFDGTLK